MDKKDKLQKLNEELVVAKERYQHMLTQYSETRAGSAYGVEYYDIQLKVLEEMIADINKEVLKIKSSD